MARRFNLQPWRNELREAQKKEFTTWTVVIAMLAIGLCAGYYFLKKEYIETQQSGIAKLDAEIETLKPAKDEITRIEALNKEVTKQIKVIEELQAQRSLSVELLDYIATNIPDEVFINHIEYKNKQMNIDGTAESEVGVSALIRVIQSFDKVNKVEVVRIKMAEDNKRYTVSEGTSVREFTLSIAVKPFTTTEEN